MTDIVIVGTGAHGREVLDILRAQRLSGEDVEPVGFVHDGWGRTQGAIEGLSVIGDLRCLGDQAAAGARAICAVGTPLQCERLVERIRRYGIGFASAISPSSTISANATLGEGAMVFPNVVVNTGARIGSHVTLNIGVSVSHDCAVGDFCSLAPGARLAGGVTLGGRSFVGMGAAVIQDRTVGAGVVVGAGAVVLGDIPDGVTTVGVPARIVGPASLTPMD